MVKLEVEKHPHLIPRYAAPTAGGFFLFYLIKQYRLFLCKLLITYDTAVPQLPQLAELFNGIAGWNGLHTDTIYPVLLLIGQNRCTLIISKSAAGYTAYIYNGAYTKTAESEQPYDTGKGLVYIKTVYSETTQEYA